MTFETRLKKYEKILSTSEKEISTFILMNKEKVLSSTIKDITSLIFYSRASIFRLLKKLGYSGLKELKKELVFFPKQDYPHFNLLLTQFIQSLSESNTNHNLRIVEDIVKKIKQGYMVRIYGRGFSKELAKIFAKELNKLGYLTTFFRDEYEINSSSKNSIAILISFSGRWKSMDKIIESAYKKLGKGNVFLFFGNQLVDKNNVVNIKYDFDKKNIEPEIPIVSSSVFLFMINQIIYKLIM